MRNAVDAMERALQQLQTQKTAGAIPHEMAALNALLQAQAEIRKRQVQQQQNSGGGGGGNRQSQDLSNLFDRELKRQQQTNYETKAQVETQPEAAEDRQRARPDPRSRAAAGGAEPAAAGAREGRPVRGGDEARSSKS